MIRAISSSFALFTTISTIFVGSVSAQDIDAPSYEERRSEFLASCTAGFDNENVCGCTFDRLERYPGFDYTDTQIQRIADILPNIESDLDALLGESGSDSDIDLLSKIGNVGYAIVPCSAEEHEFTYDLPPDMSASELASFGLGPGADLLPPASPGSSN